MNAVEAIAQTDTLPWPASLEALQKLVSDATATAIPEVIEARERLGMTCDVFIDIAAMPPAVQQNIIEAHRDGVGFDAAIAAIRLAEKANRRKDEKAKQRAETNLGRVLAQLEAGPYQPEGGWRTGTTLDNCRLVCGQRLNGDSPTLACAAIEWLSHQQPDTVRGTLYGLVQIFRLLPDTGNKSYRAAQRLLVNLRRKHILPYRWIVDNIRSTEKPQSWSGLAEYTETVRDAYRKDYWAHLPDYVCVIVEKDTVAGRVSPVTREYDVALHPLRGSSSETFAFEIGDSWQDIQKPIHVYYVGDHDPKGRDIERDIKNKLAKFSGRPFTWKRLAVNPEHFDQFGITALPVKVKDKCGPKFIAQYGDRCAEVEAIPANTLRDMVRDAIESHIPSESWERLKKQEEIERGQWSEFMGKIGGTTP